MYDWVPEHLVRGRGRKGGKAGLWTSTRFLIKFQCSIPRPSFFSIVTHRQGEMRVSGRVDSKQTRHIFLLGASGEGSLERPMAKAGVFSSATDDWNRSLRPLRRVRMEGMIGHAPACMRDFKV
jgi:hypothetical protein